MIQDRGEPKIFLEDLVAVDKAQWDEIDRIKKEIAGILKAIDELYREVYKNDASARKRL